MVIKKGMCKCWVKKNIEIGVVYIYLMFNNILIMIIDV